MTLPWLLLLLLPATFAGRLSKEENERRKEKCQFDESLNAEILVAPRVKRRQPVEASEYPFAAAFTRIDVYPPIYVNYQMIPQEAHTEPMCSGVLISPRHILTAAHCLYIFSGKPCSLKTKRPVESIGFFLQSGCKEAECWYEENPHKSTSVFMHPAYKICKSEDDVDGAKQAQNDIAVVELSENVNIAPICMPEVNSAISNQEEFESIGYGKGGGQRRIQSVRYENVQQLGEIIFAYNKTEKNDLLKGDSGGPLIRKMNGRHYLFGIASRAVHGKNVTYGYHEQEQIISFAGGYFADVRKHLDWICKVSGVCSEATNRQSESVPIPPPAWLGQPMGFQEKFAENGNY